MVFVFLFSVVSRGSSDQHQRCSTWAGKCAGCSKSRTWLQGIFCANFYWTLGGFPPCRTMWCGECYSSSDEVRFHVQTGPSAVESDPEDAPRLTKRWGRKQRPADDFCRARNGDHTMVPFECDTCIFRKLTSRIFPEKRNPQDQLLLACIRRMNLDAFWSRATGTVNGQRDKLALAIKLSGLVGLKGPCKHEGPLPDFDHCGYEAAIDMLLYSKRPVKSS